MHRTARRDDRADRVRAGRGAQGPWNCKYFGKGELLGTPGSGDRAVIVAQEAVYGTDGALAHDIVITCWLQTAVTSGPARSSPR